MVPGWLVALAAVASSAVALTMPATHGFPRKRVCLESMRRQDYKDWQTRTRAGENAIDRSLRGAKRGGRGRARKSAETWRTEVVYASRLRALLRLERNAEEALAKERLERWPPSKLASAGLALFGLRARKRSQTLFGRTIVRFEMRRGGARVELPFHKFGEGDLVVVRSRDGEDKVEGTVLARTAGFLEVVVASGGWSQADGPGTKKQSWRMDQYYSTVSFERMDAAVDAICAESSGFSPEGGPLDLSLRRILLRPADSPALAEERTGGLRFRAPSDDKARRAVAALVGNQRGGTKFSLDASQAAAAAAALVSRAALIVGPPGTGKTRVAAATLAAAIKLRDAESKASSYFRSKALACAASNVAADNLLEQLVLLDVSVVRLGNPASTRADLRNFTLDALVDQRMRTVDGSAYYDSDEASSSSSSSHAAHKARKEAHAAAILFDADVVVASCVGAGASILAPFLNNNKNAQQQKTMTTTPTSMMAAPPWKFGTVLIDEAAQATEPACLIPLAAARGARQVILVGDAAQLAPTVISAKANFEGLRVSLFERLQLAGVRPHVLTRQYRMHPTLNAFSSHHFYGNSVKTDAAVAEDRLARPPPAGFAWPNAHQPLAFVSLSGAHSERVDHTNVGASYSNPREARAVATVVANLLLFAQQQKEEEGDDDQRRGIGIITPYAAQARLINDELQKRHLLAKVEVNTVDAYQGREKDLIVISAVRSNPGGKVGFLSDARRLNVALTRARRGLVVLGDHETLSNDKHWKKFIDHCDTLGCFVAEGHPLHDDAASSDDE